MANFTASTKLIFDCWVAAVATDRPKKQRPKFLTNPISEVRRATIHNRNFSASPSAQTRKILFTCTSTVADRSIFRDSINGVPSNPVQHLPEVPFE
jgi:hypothetical protein